MNKKDWRLTNQLEYLSEKALVKRQYQPYREGWDHDHCEFCGERIDGSSPFAYATKDSYYWICEQCYEDFKDMFHWVIIQDE